MVTMNHLSVEDPDDGSPLLPEAVEAQTPTPVFRRQRAVAKTDSRQFFLSRYTSAGAIFTLWSCYSIYDASFVVFFFLLCCTGGRTLSSV